MSDKKYPDIIKEGHSYDGIQEYDNPMPGWWKNLFWATIVFSIGYCGYYLSGIGLSHEEEYQLELAELEQSKPEPSATASATEENLLSTLITASLDAQKVEAGKATFIAKCAACHGANAAGVIGPNLTDNTWIHGGDLESIHRIIVNGVVEKGMIPWKGQLSDAQIVEVIAFVRSIQNTNVSGKAPEGEPSEPTALVVN